MTDHLHDTLTAEAQERETLEHDTREISDKLEDIRFMYPQLADTMLTIGSQALDLTGVRGTTQRIPGGDALTMLAPYSVGYDEPDDLPHPAQVVREWADRWRDATRTPHRPGEKWASHLAILQANTAWYIRQDQSGAFRDDIRALWGRLSKLVGDAPEKAPEPEITDEMVIKALKENPEHRITRKEVGLIFGITPSTITTWRSRGLTVDEKGCYRAGDILERLAA